MKAGKTFDEIAALEGGGTTRNAVAGAIYRYRQASGGVPAVKLTSKKDAALWHARNMAGESFDEIAVKDSAPGRQLTRECVAMAVRRWRGGKGIKGPGAGRRAKASKKKFVMTLTQPSFLSDMTLCHWIEGDPKTPDAVFCGHPHLPGKPYCEGHHALSRAGYTSASKAAKDAEGIDA